MSKFAYVRNAGLLTAMTFLAWGCGAESDKKKINNPNNPNDHVSMVEDDEIVVTEPEQTNTTSNKTTTLNTPAMQKKKVTKAHVVLSAKGESTVVGAITFTQMGEGVRIIADVGGLNPGKHGFHIHEHGDCGGADASSAGGHFNPTNKKHGGPDSAERHMGDLGNLEANKSGFAHYDRVDNGLSLNGEYSIIGKSVIVHADEDDLKTDPSGNSGKKIACGVIVASE